jgi:protein O-mannosyl-transferase
MDTAPRTQRRIDWHRCAPWLIIAAGIAAYANSFTGVFVFDDMRWIVEYTPIRQLSPPWYLADNSRPLVSLTLALNYACSGLQPWSYHAFNLIVHILAGLTLYGLVRRTLMGFGRSPTGIALAAAILWLVHPLQTESVTYVIQRAESMMGLFYLLTLYCAARGGRWEWAAVLACLAGMLTKPVMVTAPVAVALYDSIFLSRRRWRLYAMLAATWLALAWVLHAGANDWERSAGYGLRRFTLLQFSMTQPAVILHYLQLVVWPHPLCLDYGWSVGFDIPATIVVAGMLMATLRLLRRNSAAGFAAAWFWLTLAPSSSMIPIGDLAFEHRMYLPLAGLVVLAVCAGYRLPLWIRIGGFCVLAGTFCVVTTLRNADYRSALTIWRDTVAAAPQNARAHQNLGKAYEEAGKTIDALRHYAEAVRLDPNDPRSRYALATALAQDGKIEAAVEEFNAAIALWPDYAEAHYNLGVALTQLGRGAEAREHFNAAARLRVN